MTGHDRESLISRAPCSPRPSIELQEAKDVKQEWKERYNDLLEANVAKKREIARVSSKAAEWKRKYELLLKPPTKCSHDGLDSQTLSL